MIDISALPWSWSQ